MGKRWWGGNPAESYGNSFWIYSSPMQSLGNFFWKLLIAADAAAEFIGSME